MSIMSGGLVFKGYCGRARAVQILGASAARVVVVLAMSAATLISAQAHDSKLLPPVTIDAPPASPLLPNGGNREAPAPTLTGQSDSATGTGDRAQRRCVDVTIGNDTSFGCINERLKHKVDEVNPVLNLPPIDARSSDLKVGTVNIPAVQQQYGRNFGQSVVPYRPVTIYPSPSGRH